MKIQEILRRKGSEVHMIGPDDTADDVVEQLVEFNVGSLIVCVYDEWDEAIMVGIITERDVLRAHAAHRAKFDQLFVRDIMGIDVITAASTDSLQDAMRLMTVHRIRHLPVFDGGVLQGIISIGDIVKMHHDELEMENHYMKSYIQGEGAEIATPC